MPTMLLTASLKIRNTSRRTFATDGDVVVGSRCAEPEVDLARGTDSLTKWRMR